MSDHYNEMLKAMLQLVNNIAGEPTELELEDDGVELMKEMSMLKYLQSLEDEEFYQA
jgi:hypothetical protein